MTALVATWAGLLGLVVGSFLNVVIHRVPRGESLVRPASRCPGCGNEIASRDNVPVISWLILRGRCRSCRRPISVRYPLVEAATAGLWVAAAVRFARIEEAAFVAVAATVLLALALIDLEHRRLPNVIVLPCTAAAALWVAVAALAMGDPDLLVTSLVCGVAAFALFFLIAFVSGGMGFGDVKLAGFVGIVAGRFGWEVAVASVFASFFVGGGVAVLLLVMRRAGRKQAIPFGPALAVGTLIALFAGPSPVRQWLGV